MQAFTMPHNNTCASCGADLPKGASVFAENFDEVRAGLGICAECANPKPKRGKKAEAEG